MPTPTIASSARSPCWTPSARPCSRKWNATQPSSPLGEDIGVYGGAFKVTDGLLARFGRERVIDTPISETAIVGAACGMSFLGLRPVAEMQFIDFIACCFNQVTNFVAKSHYLWGARAYGLSRPLRRRRPWRALSFRQPGNVFCAHAGAESVYPSTAYDAKGLLKSAIRDNNPVLFFEQNSSIAGMKEEMPPGDYRAHRQRFRCLLRPTSCDRCASSCAWLACRSGRPRPPSERQARAMDKTKAAPQV